eukprot:scaffold26158_cov23-Tisochrysis_lutea.AAC.1
MAVYIEWALIDKALGRASQGTTFRWSHHDPYYYAYLQSGEQYNDALREVRAAAGMDGSSSSSSYQAESRYIGEGAEEERASHHNLHQAVASSFDGSGERVDGNGATHAEGAARSSHSQVIRSQESVLMGGNDDGPAHLAFVD